MERRAGNRVRTEFDVVVKSADCTLRAQALELSASGLLLRLNNAYLNRSASPWVGLELRLPGSAPMIFARGRCVRSMGSEQAYAIEASDADRLSLAEHVDWRAQAGLSSPN